MRRAGQRVRITAQLIEAANGAHLWAERYDRSLDDIFAVQDEVAQHIVSTLVGRIEDARLQLSLRKPTTSLAAYDCLLRGLAHFRDDTDSANQQALEMFEKAVALDPRYAVARSYLAFVAVAMQGHAPLHPPRYWTRHSSRQQLQWTAEAQAAAAEVVRLQPDFSTAQYMRDSVLLERAEDRELLREGLLKAGLPA